MWKQVKKILIIILIFNVLSLSLTLCGITGNNRTINKIQRTIDSSVYKYATIDTYGVDRFKRANYEIYNNTVGCYGSGTHIRIKQTDYILTCAHVVKSNFDELIAVDDNSAIHKLYLAKINRSMDLALFWIKTPNDSEPLYISQEEPNVGSRIKTIGNPSHLVDVITEGTICKKSGIYYFMTNKIAGGNSGGAILYKGKVVGVVTQIRYFGNNLVQVNYSYGPNLKALRIFLKEYYE